MDPHSNTNLAEEEDEDFLCPICREYPSAEVLQCAEGHIFCKRCYFSMLRVKPECATCRCYIDATRPIRNRIAEKKISQMPARCPNFEIGCTEIISRGVLQDHLSKSCPYRTTVCRGTRMGCQWKGFIKDNESHEQNCIYTKVLPLIDRFGNEIDKTVANLMQTVNQRLDLLSQRISDIEDAQNQLQSREPNQTFAHSFSFKCKGSNWITHTFQAFDSGWELAVRMQAKPQGLSTTSRLVKNSGVKEACTDHLQLKLKPDTFYASQQQNMFSIAISCVHPDSSKNIRISYKYNNIPINPQRFLHEPCFLSSSQLQSFMNEREELEIRLSMKKHSSQQEEDDSSLLAIYQRTKLTSNSADKHFQRKDSNKSITSN